MRKYKEKMKKFNVLHLMSSFNTGGAEKLLLDILEKAKTDNCINYHVLSLKDSVNQEYINTLSSLDIPFTAWPTKNYKNPITLYKLLKFIKENNISIIHTHEDGAKAWSIICKLFKPDLKLIYTIHASNVIVDYNCIKIFLHKKFVNATIAISKDINKQCSMRSLLNVYHIDNGINLSIWKKNEEKNDLNSDVFKILNVARMSLHKKAHDVLINALGICKQRGLKFQCSFIGGSHPGYPNAFADIKKLASDNGIKSDIVIMGHRNDVYKIIHEFDLFILPSRSEGMPIALLEAMAAGLPIISSNIPISKELISHGVNGILFESENYNDLADKIEELYNNREKMHQIAQNGYKFVQQFDISNTVNKYHSLYKKVLEVDNVEKN